jgi:hypothetical protein
VHLSVTPRFVWTAFLTLVVAPVAAGALVIFTADSSGRHAAAYGAGIFALAGAFAVVAAATRRKATSRTAVLVTTGTIGALALTLALVTLATM